ncbi:MAG: hypothetical protein KI793_15445 [Rivularia sp. (in: Bacteria)]|nr:hypothetical protein [Rivularia sp. MS3]
MKKIFYPLSPFVFQITFITLCLREQAAIKAVLFFSTGKYANKCSI